MASELSVSPSLPEPVMTSKENNLAMINATDETENTVVTSKVADGTEKSETLQDSNIDHGRPWSTMVDRGRPWSTMVDHGRLLPKVAGSFVL